jgi:hypothetical protein
MAWESRKLWKKKVEMVDEVARDIVPQLRERIGIFVSLAQLRGFNKASQQLKIHIKVTTQKAKLYSNTIPELFFRSFT